ncbi:hypothetical protein GCM10020367_20450 [Streptomyces sannanensis]|uniref:Uncharacterized protein n=1 Tax=Streptomyces sannanensis TaxID=285536 RepID=A0ABP6S8Z8_9ACTN
MRLAAHAAGRHGILLRRGRLADAVVEALLAHGDGETAVRLHGDRLSPAMCRRIAEHPDPAIRDAYADFVRDMVDRGCARSPTNRARTCATSPCKTQTYP